MNQQQQTRRRFLTAALALTGAAAVHGPLILADDSDRVLGWHDKAGEVKHCGLAFLQEMPDEIAAWIVNEANRIESEFAAFMDAAAKNSPTSSAPSVEGEEAAPS